MAKVDHLKQMQGKYLTGGRPSERRNRRGRDSINRVVDVANDQANTLNYYIKQETKFYNSLVESLQTKLRRTPEFFDQLTDRHFELYCQLAYSNFEVRSLMNKKSDKTEVPANLEKYRDILFGIHGDKEAGMDETLSMFYESCGEPASVLPKTREAMAFEMIEFCTKQSKIMTESAFLRDDQSYRTSPDMLSTVSIMQKRHLQIRKDDIECKWNEANNESSIKLPHLQKPLIIEGIRLVGNEAEPADVQWNLLILHQDPSQVLTIDTPWIADFRSTLSRYMLKYLESANPTGHLRRKYIPKRDHR